MSEHHAGHDQACVCWRQRSCGCYLWDTDCPNYEPITKENTMEENKTSVELGPHTFTEDEWKVRVELGQQTFTEVITDYARRWHEGIVREEMSRMQQCVAQFHEAMGQPVGHSPRHLPVERVAVRVELIREEFIDELIPALGAKYAFNPDGSTTLHSVSPDQQDIVEVADACIDILYVVFGLLVEMGINATPLFEEVQASNMSKLGADGKPIIAGPNDPDGIFEGRVKKGPNYFKPNLEALIRAQSPLEHYEA